MGYPCLDTVACCNNMLPSVNEEKRLMMHVHVQMRRDELQAPKPLAHCDMKVPGQLLPFCWAALQFNHNLHL